jgi:hypothetical protein
LAVRSSTDDFNDPEKVLGLNVIVRDLSSQAKKILDETSTLKLHADFNLWASGVDDNVGAGAMFAEMEHEDRLHLIERNIYKYIILGVKEKLGLGELDDLQVIQKLIGFGTETIRVSFQVSRMVVISKFRTNNENLNTLTHLFAEENLREGGASDNLRVVLHFRKGDTSVFPLPNGNFVASWGDWKKSRSNKTYPEIIYNREDSIYPQLRFSDYIDALRFIGHVYDGPVSPPNSPG